MLWIEQNNDSDTTGHATVMMLPILKDVLKQFSTNERMTKLLLKLVQALDFGEVSSHHIKVMHKFNFSVVL